MSIRKVHFSKSMRLFAAAMGLLVLTSGISPAGAEESRYTSRQTGYSLVVPQGWEQISDEVIQDFFNRSFSPSLKSVSSLEAGFQVQNGDETFSSAYAIVQVMPYAKLGITGPITDQMVENFVAEIRNANLNDALKDGRLNKDVSASISDARKGTDSFDKQRRRYIWTIDTTLANSTQMHGVCAVHFGPDAIVQVMFYAPKSEWDNHWTVCGQMIESFRFETAGVLNVNGLPGYRKPYSFYTP